MKIATLVLVLIASARPDANAGPEPVILDFHASWCGPCKQMRPTVELLIQKGYPVKSIDIDHAQKLAAKYQVSAVPTTIIIDADGQELERTQGPQSASHLAALYKRALSRVSQKPGSAERTQVEPEPREEADEPEREQSASAAEPLPKPWETVVRIRVIGAGMIGFGSGTIVSSTPEESIILTCAHIFHIEGARTQPHPARFPRKIVVDLFDGKLQGNNPAMVHHKESVEGQAVDYDFSSDVGLIRIRPGKRLPASPVVPEYWKPQPRMEMVAVGCPEGNDATAWTTHIINPRATMRLHGRVYEAIECQHAPKQGRSGGGLYTTDGYVAGVCDFAEPEGNHGLYAAPQAIYRMLDKHKLSMVHAGPRRGSDRLVAQNRPPARTVRAQSPDRNESKKVTLPSPEILGIEAPAAGSTAQNGQQTRRSWHPSQEGQAPAVASTRSAYSPVEEDRVPTIPVEIQIDASAVQGPFDSIDAPARSENPAPKPKPQNPGRWRAVNSAPAGINP